MSGSIFVYLNFILRARSHGRKRADFCTYFWADFWHLQEIRTKYRADFCLVTYFGHVAEIFRSHGRKRTDFRAEFCLETYFLQVQEICPKMSAENCLYSAIQHVTPFYTRSTDWVTLDGWCVFILLYYIIRFTLCPRHIFWQVAFLLSLTYLIQLAALTTISNS